MQYNSNKSMASDKVLQRHNYIYLHYINKFNKISYIIHMFVVKEYEIWNGKQFWTTNIYENYFSSDLLAPGSYIPFSFNTFLS